MGVTPSVEKPAEWAVTGGKLGVAPLTFPATTPLLGD